MRSLLLDLFSTVYCIISFSGYGACVFNEPMKFARLKLCFHEYCEMFVVVYIIGNGSCV